MAFAALSGQESMAQRILLYPSEWDLHNDMDPVASVSARLLRKAASKYKVMLQPIDPMQASVSDVDDEDNNPTYSDEERYPLTTLLTLSHYNRILYLQPSGLILSSTPLDLLFTYPLPPKTAVLAFDSPIPSSADRPSLMLLEPSPKAHTHIRNLLPEGSFTDTEFHALIRTLPAPPSTLSEDQQPAMLLAETSALGNVDGSFNKTWFLDSTGYVHIQDDGIPGPQHEWIDVWVKEKGPSRREARQAWEAVYELFREGWKEVCGLELLPTVVEEEKVEEGDAVDEVKDGAEVEAGGETRSAGQKEEQKHEEAIEAGGEASGTLRAQPGSDAAGADTKDYHSIKEEATLGEEEVQASELVIEEDAERIQRGDKEGLR